MKKGENRFKWDYGTAIIICLVMLCCFGLLMVYSASAYTCAMEKGDSMYYLNRQAVFMVAGFITIFASRFMDYSVLLRRLSKIAYVVGILSILLLLTRLGMSANGATRWLQVPGTDFGLQVAELVKITVIAMLAHIVTTYRGHLQKPAVTIYLWLAGGGPAILLFLISNDLSSAIVILGITFLTSLLACRSYKIHIIVAAIAVLFVLIYVLRIYANMPTVDEIEQYPFRDQRIAAWIDPFRYPKTAGYQIVQSLYAVGSGGLFGKGLGNSRQKLRAIPEGQNDMIFSIMCEELGILGVAVFLLLIGYLLYQIVMIAVSTTNIYNRVFAIGVVLHISLQTIINISVNINLFPNTGLPLPFFSYGGTSVFLLLVEVAVVLSMDFHEHKKQADYKAGVRRFVAR